MTIAIAFALSLGCIAVLARAALRSGAAGPQPLAIGAGVTLSIAPVKRQHARTASSDLLPLPVTLTNHGAGTIRVSYRDFSLTDGAGQRSMALLPSELLFEKVSAPLLPEGAITGGQSSSGSLYFHLPSSFVRPIGLRIDLEAPDGTALAQTIVPL